MKESRMSSPPQLRLRGRRVGGGEPRREGPRRAAVGCGARGASDGSAGVGARVVQGGSTLLATLGTSPQVFDFFK